ncbi:ribonuclease R [Peptoniphilus sp.]|jgi:ribonuclease R|uniref:ribonuclease R n=1 Tax=Peptoniphilus sp. TaxID=1971214 RepID=UPI003D94C23D
MIKEKIFKIIEESKPLSKDDLMKHLGIKNKEKKGFKKILDEMENEGLIFLDKREKYKVVDNKKYFYGKVQTTSKGFGFLMSKDLDEDIYISKNNLSTALNGDEVIVKKYDDKSGDRDEGKVVSVVKRANNKVVGIFEDKRDFGFVIADESKLAMNIYIPKKKIYGARNGQKVVVKIEKWPTGTKKPEGRIIEVLGYPTDPHVDIMSIAAAMELPMDFSKSAMSEAKQIPQEVREEDLEYRKDFRDLTTFTIDGADSKDFDDAVSLEVLENGDYRLGVHIADVAHYVDENSEIEREAYKRGNSVYLLNKVIPMLPFELSNGICSLNEGVDRLTLSCMMNVDKTGKVKKYEIVESVINSNRRLVYEDVSDFLEDGKVSPSIEGLQDILLNMYELSKTLQKRREEGGAIDFDIPEVVIEVNEDGWPTDIYKKDRRSANKLIEDFMLLANVCVAKRYFYKEIPFLYRVHERPENEKISELNSYIRPLGYALNFDKEVSPMDIQKLLKKVKGKKEELFISTLTLRAMQKAKYSAYQDIHFGLSFEHYTHFTSPIRRYCDLTVHRIIKKDIAYKLSPKTLLRLETELPEIADHISDTEKKAQDAERQVESVKMAEYMSERIGEEYDGFVSSITSFGMFVELPNLVEGLVSYKSMDGYFEFDVENYKAIDYETKIEFHIGDEVKIEVSNVDLNMGTIDFKLVGDLYE